MNRGSRPPVNDLQLTSRDNLVELRARGNGRFGSHRAAPSDGIIVITNSGEVLLQNPAWLDVTGIAASDVPLARVASHFGLYRADQITPLPSGELAYHGALLCEIVQGQEIFQRNAERPEGGWLNGSGTPQRDEAGAIGGAVGVIRDVTGNKRAEFNRDGTVEPVHSALA